MNQGEAFNPFGVFAGADIPYWLLGRKEIGPGPKICYGLMCRYIGDPELVPLLADKMGVEQRQVHRYITDLENSGLIRRKKVGGNKPDEYIFVWHKWIEETVPYDEQPEGYHSSRVEIKRQYKRSTTVPEDFSITTDILNWIKKTFPESSATNQDLEYSRIRFVQHHVSKGTKCMDWDSKFKEWIANAVVNGWLERKELPKIPETSSEPQENPNKKKWSKFNE